VKRTPQRGEPLKPGRWYLPPALIPARADGSPRFQAQQGDIFENGLSVWIAQRPIRVARDFRPQGAGERIVYTALSEDQEPASQPYEWREGEDVIVRAVKGYAVLLTQDCELDKPRPMLTFALIRVIDGSQHAEDIEIMRNRGKYRSFYLEEQTEEPRLPKAYVDFGRLTTVHPTACRLDDRILSMSDDVRDALREDFIEFMTLEREGDEG
jgi:hypothetical protein